MRAIACISSDGQLVAAAQTPRDDKHRFAALTAGGACIVGGKTWRELPPKMRDGGGARRYEVLTKADTFCRPGIAMTFRGYELLTLMTVDPTLSDAWVIGGNAAYALCAPFTTMLYLSILRTPGGVGAFPFPDFKTWDVVCDQTHTSHCFMIWKKK